MSKSIIFLEKSFLGNFYRHLAIFSGHTASHSIKSEQKCAVFFCGLLIGSESVFEGLNVILVEWTQNEKKEIYKWEVLDTLNILVPINQMILDNKSVSII